LIDLQYLHQISYKLDRFKKKSQHLYNFRCPYCGDSQKKQSKARGFVYRSKQDYFFKCHNCGKGTSLGKLIEHIDPDLYKKWVVEKFKKGSKKHKEPEFEFKPVRFDDKNLKKLKKLSELPHHPAYDLFITKRKLEDHADKFYVTWHFMTWVNSIIPNKFPNIKEDHPRIVIPFFDTSGKMFAFQGRAFGDEEPKYVTIKLDENKRRIYGLDRIDIKKEIKVVEGPIDSLFIDNAVACAGADMVLPRSKDNAVYIFDNEPRNTVIIKKIENLITQGYRVCIWPKNIKEKDINDLIMSGYSKVEIEDIIHNNTFSKLSAIQQLNNYKEV
jgi:transcription elongation factor Elf1|tara:strand:- start:3556 stop:4539 length:984 start_codon:yes stop_codon:yes gene_type:complete